MQAWDLDSVQAMFGVGKGWTRWLMGLRLQGSLGVVRTPGSLCQKELWALCILHSRGRMDGGEKKEKKDITTEEKGKEVKRYRKEN